MKKLILILVLLFCFAISLVALSGCAKKEEAEQPAAEEVTEEPAAEVDTTAVPVDTIKAEEEPEGTM